MSLSREPDPRRKVDDELKPEPNGIHARIAVILSRQKAASRSGHLRANRMSRAIHQAATLNNVKVRFKSSPSAPSTCRSVQLHLKGLYRTVCQQPPFHQLLAIECTYYLTTKRFTSTWLQMSLGPDTLPCLTCHAGQNAVDQGLHAAQWVVRGNAFVQADIAEHACLLGFKAAHSIHRKLGRCFRPQFARISAASKGWGVSHQPVI